MARLLTLVVDLDTLPGDLEASIRAVLNQKGIVVGEAVLRELGRNVAQAVVLSDAREVES